MFPEASAVLHNFVLTALLAPNQLGIPPPDSHSAKRLAIKAKVPALAPATLPHGVTTKGVHARHWGKGWG